MLNVRTGQLRVDLYEAFPLANLQHSCVYGFYLVNGTAGTDAQHIPLVAPALGSVCYGWTAHPSVYFVRGEHFKPNFFHCCNTSSDSASGYDFPTLWVRTRPLGPRQCSMIPSGLALRSPMRCKDVVSISRYLRDMVLARVVPDNQLKDCP